MSDLEMFIQYSRIEAPDRLVLWHASRSQAAIFQFRPFTHFGTLEAALERANCFPGQDFSFYEVEIDVRCPVQLDDLTKAEHGTPAHSIATMITLLDQNNMITVEERRSLEVMQTDPAAATGRLLEILAERGIDAIAYINNFEDVGSISWICTDPSKVRVLRTLTHQEAMEAAGQRPRGMRP